MSVVIFDLDDTLIDSELLRSMRDNGLWKLITRSEIAKVSLFPGILEMLNTLRSSGCKIAIVTTAPRLYSEQIIASLSIPCDTLVASGDAKWGKPDEAPSRLALENLGHSDPSTAFVVGDRCIDIVSGQRICKWTIGAKWGTKNLRDLMLAYPKFIASSPSEVTHIVLTVLAGGQPDQYSWVKAMSPKLWLDPPPSEYRQHLTGAGIPFKFARIYRGKSRSWTDNRIWLFKTKNKNQWRYKRMAAAYFAHELVEAIPSGSWVLFVLPSALKGTSDYDDRWESLTQELIARGGEKGWNFVQAISVIEASIPAHEQAADSADRDPEVIKRRLRWIGGIPSDASDVTIIDDVITKGGHLRAYYDIVRANCPSARIHLRAWAVFSSHPWHQCPYGKLF